MKECDQKKVRVVYMGRRIDSKNKIVHLYGYQDNLASQFTVKKKLGQYGVGALIEVTNYGDYFKPPYIGVGKYQDITKVASWDIEDTLNYYQHISQQHWRKLEPEQSEYEKLVCKINELIALLPPSQKKAFLFKLIADIDFKG